MPWHVERSTECPSDRPWAVVQDNTGRVVGCHDTEDSAAAQVAALYASEADSLRRSIRP